MRKGLYANIHAKRKRGERMRKKGEKGAPTAAQFRRAAQTVRKASGGLASYKLGSGRGADDAEDKISRERGIKNPIQSATNLALVKRRQDARRKKSKEKPAKSKKKLPLFLIKKK